ncbi:MAG: hypothetical protein H7061_02800 [Bdellovibrionaceae bacterium]|nr:hypothetical protein [Bdellovibrio sp.]
MKTKILSVFFLINVFFNSISWAQRIGFSSEQWKVIKTEHFDVVFSAQQQDLGLYYAQVAERAYAQLATVFSFTTNHLVLVVNDTTDISNGYATRIPYPLIMAYTVQIGDHESLSEAGEWGRELLTHELTHILQFEPAEGFYRFLKPVFGNIIAPNMLMPLWWKEGMAVEMETQFSPRGRSRSMYQDSTLRALVMDRKLFDYTIPQANEVLPSWPYGSRSYLFGSVFWSHFLSENKISAVDTIVSRQGRRAPYAINTPVEEITGSNYETEYNKALYKVYQNAKKQLSQIHTEEVTPFKTIEQNGQNSFAPKISRAHQLIANIEQHNGESHIVIKNFNGEYVKLKGLPKEGLSSLDFHPTEKKLIYTKADMINSKYKFSDIYIYNIETQKSEPLTKGLRARDASFSEDGREITFISTAGGHTQVSVLQLADKKIETFADSGLLARYESPLNWSNDEILVTKREATGQQKLYRITKLDKKEVEIALPVDQIRFLRKRNQSLYFVSSTNGVQNIYVTNDFKKVEPVTNVATGIWSYDIDVEKNKAYATVMTGHGFHVSEVAIKPHPKPLPIVENEILKRYTYKDVALPTTQYTLNDYASGSYLWPQYWIPYVATSSSSRGVYLQAQTSGQDPLNIHQYALVVSYETGIGKGGLLGTYNNAAFAVPFQVGSTVQNRTYGTIDSLVETKNAYFGLLPDIFSINKNMLFEIGYKTEETIFLETKTQHVGPFVQLAYIDYTQNIFQISPEKGWGGFVRIENNQNVQNSRDYERASAAVLGYASNFLPEHHAIMLRLNGIVTFENVSSRFGSSNSALPLYSNALIPQFPFRGYLDGQFFGRSIASVNTEYRFPIMTIEKGSGTAPYFLKRLSGAFVVDGLAVEGQGYTEDKTYVPLHMNQTMWSTGIEAKLETTLLYILPFNLILGFYQPHSPQFVSSGQIRLNIQLGGL